VVVDAFHGFGGDHGVDNGFFGGLNRREEDWVEGVVGEHGELVDALGADGAGVGGGEGEEDVAGAVAGVAAVAAEAERNFAGDAFELCGDERGVGGDDDDDGADIFFEDGVLGDFAADVDAGDAEFVAGSVVALHEDADGVASFFGGEHADDVPMPPLNSLQIIPVPPPTFPSSTAPECATSSAWNASSGRT